MEIISGDIFHLSAIPGQFDYVLAEAILTMQSPLGQVKILAGMTFTITNSPDFVSHLRAQIEYPHAGVLSKVLVKDKPCQSTLFCLAANTNISEHTSTRNATITVIEGRGLLTLLDKDIVLEPGGFVFIPANAPHALKSEEKLAFMLTLSENAADSN